MCTPHWPWQHAAPQQNSQEQLAVDKNHVSTAETAARVYQKQVALVVISLYILSLSPINFVFFSYRCEMPACCQLLSLAKFDFKASRLCTHCGGVAVANERHAQILDSPCTYICLTRQQYAPLFSTDTNTMGSSFAQDHMQVFMFVSICLQSSHTQMQ